MLVGKINHEEVQALGIFDKENNERPQKEDANTGRGSTSSSSDNEEDQNDGNDQQMLIAAIAEY